MRRLSSRDILNLWEWGQGRQPVDRALAPLYLAFPEMTWADLASLSIGWRDGYLLALYEQVFSDTVTGLSACPRCAEDIEFSLPVQSVRVEANRKEETLPRELVVEDIVVQFRLPDSTDLGALAACRDVPAARRQLARRCIIKATRRGSPLAPSRVPAKIIRPLAERILECDPQAEVLFDLQCPGCRHRWQLLLDIAVYIWSAISCYAIRLLRDVHSLARAYGWDEDHILAMSPGRRQRYLDMVAA